MSSRETPAPTVYERMAAAFMSFACDKAMEKRGISNMAALTKALSAELGPGNEISRNTLDNWRLGKGKAGRMEAAFALLKMAELMSIEVILILVVNNPDLMAALPEKINIPQVISHARAVEGLLKARRTPNPDS